MFKSEQNVSKNTRNSAEVPVLATGMAFAKAGSVKRDIPYKEILLAVGIAVAMVVALTLWDRPATRQATSDEIKNVPALNIENTAKTFFRISVKLFVSTQ